MHYKSIVEMVSDVDETIKQLKSRIKIIDGLGIYEMMHELMENYVAQKYTHSSDMGELRNDFVKLSALALNKLSNNDVFQEKYKVK